MKRFVVGLLFALVLVPGPRGGAAAGDAADAPPPEPVTTANPHIPVDELELLLKPLTKSQLLIEAQAWQALVQAKAQQISRAEITVKRQNQEIEKTDVV
jgi:small conductance mechanosensitive channel